MVASQVPEVAMTLPPLSWALPFAWGLTIKSETIWLKRAMASLPSIQIRAPLPNSLRLRIRATLPKASPSVGHLTSIPGPIGAEEA